MKNLTALTLAGLLTISGCEAQKNLISHEVNSPISFYDGRKAGDPIPYGESRANGFFEDTPDIVSTPEVEKRLEEVRNLYRDLAIESVFGEVPQPKEKDNPQKVIIGFNVYPVVYGAGNSFMGDWIKYIATGEKPRLPEFKISRIYLEDSFEGTNKNDSPLSPLKLR